VRAEVLHLPVGEHADEHRTALLVEVDAPPGRVCVATTHLNFLWDHSHVRQLQVEAICRWLADRRAPDVPLVLTGDLNAEPISDEVRMLTGRAAVPVLGLGFHDAWEAAGDGAGPTWIQANTHTPDPPFEGDKRIDYVLCAWPLPHSRGVPLHAERIGLDADPDAGHPSDHLGVLVDLSVSAR
jgi:endonuclease/exonuclease/phosphatase family metal-dependent hydrolase